MVSNEYKIYGDDSLVSYTMSNHCIITDYTSESNIILYINCNWKIKILFKVKKEVKPSSKSFSIYIILMWTSSQGRLGIPVQSFYLK